ncbi:MAG: hypothetical protein ABI947_19525 [Chloroflexota bacterium]
MDVYAAQAIIYEETENADGFLSRFTISGKFLSEHWQRLQAAIHTYADSLTDEDLTLDRRVAGDLHYLTQVMTLASEVLQKTGEVNAPLEAAANALWEYNHIIFSVPQNRSRSRPNREAE